MAPVQFGSYQILRKIGAGGMAQVFEAQRLGLEGFSRRVALKCILPEMTRDSRFVEMFVNEARLGSQLHHPNIVEIQDFNKVNDIYYIAMEFVEGVDLGDVISAFRAEEREFPPGLVAEIMIQALDGLGYAHEAETDDGDTMNIIHRDIKPSNLLLTRRGTVKIADFGIAKAATNAYQTRTSEVTKGSLAYMAPEQITREAPLSPRSDLFSLGAVLFELLTLRALFDGENMPSIMFKVAQVEIERDLTDLEEVHPQFIPIIKKALERDPDDRYQTAAEMAADMQVLQERFTTDVTIKDLANQYVKVSLVEEGEESFGENTVAMLGLGTESTQGVNNLAASVDGNAYSSPNSFEESSDPSLEPPYQHPPPPEDEYPLPEYDPAPPAPVAVPAPVPWKGTPILLGFLVLVVLVGGGAFFMFENKPTTLVVSSRPPGAEIHIDGQLQTRLVSGHPESVVTPARVTLSKGGIASVSLTLEGYEPFSARLEYKDGEDQELAPVLKEIRAVGALEITSIPSGATIKLSGVELEQKTPTRLDDLPAGKRYNVLLELENYTSTGGIVEIKKDSTVMFSTTLQAPAPVMPVQSRPVAVAGKTRNSDTSSWKSGSSASTSTTQRHPAPRKDPPVARKGPPGTLVVSSVPPDCVVYVDNAKRGNAPQTLSLKPGVHRIRLQRFDGSVAKEFTVTIDSGKEVTKVWDLESQQFFSE